jgi:hypothetical protein
MTNSSGSANQLQLYRRYSDMARQASNGEIREAYGCMARDALRQAAKLDPGAVAHASGLAMAKVG